MPIFNRHLIGWACLTDSMITGQFIPYGMVTLHTSLIHIPWLLSLHKYTNLLIPHLSPVVHFPLTLLCTTHESLLYSSCDSIKYLPIFRTVLWSLSGVTSHEQLPRRRKHRQSAEEWRHGFPDTRSGHFTASSSDRVHFWWMHYCSQ